MIVVGDVHGQLKKLRELLVHVTAHYPDEELVFVGDLIDRGHYSPECLDVVEGLVRAGKARCIRGNHEEMFLGAVDVAKKNDHFPDAWLNGHAGGHTTVQAYVNLCGSTRTQAIVEEIHRQGHPDFITNRMVDFIETDDVLITHAPIPKTAGPGWRTSIEAFRWSGPYGMPEESFAMDHGKLAVCGHVSGRGKGIRRHGNQLYIDAGAGFGGPLAAVVIVNGDVRNELLFGGS